MLARLTSLFAILLFGSPLLAQKNQDRPKLVVGIIVDQMRQEYLYRFYDKFGEGGFKRLMADGFMLKNAHYNYAPTVTGAGTCVCVHRFDTCNTRNNWERLF